MSAVNACSIFSNPSRGLWEPLSCDQVRQNLGTWEPNTRGAEMKGKGNLVALSL